MASISLKRILFGAPLRTEAAEHERLNKKTALAIFSSDALSSTAYATEEILLVLAVAAEFIRVTSRGASSGTEAFNYVVPISIAIALLLAIVAASYRQTIFTYPSGGGAYIVAKDNLGTTPSLIAGASLLVDYILTVAVSIAAGVAAITSAAQGTSLAWLSNHRVELCVFFIILITIANLRGVKESGNLFAIPTYAFVASFFVMIGYGLINYFAVGGQVPVPVEEHLKIAEGYELQSLSLFLLLGAFSNGCAALTGVEAISNGVQSFEKPSSKNAAATLVWMAVLLTAMFLGTSSLAFLYGVHPHENETVISQFARLIFTGSAGWFYYVIQAATALILILAANTAFNGFPILASLISRDRFLPRQFANRGDRLVFTNGVIVLAVAAGLLVWAFRGDTSRLIPLYAVGVFLSFTLSQSGMIVHWLRERDIQLGKRTFADFENVEAIHKSAIPDVGLQAAQNELNTVQAVRDETQKQPSWRLPLAINTVGAIVTFIVLCVFIATKFLHGAWLVVVIIPILVLMFRAIHDHYVHVSEELKIETPGGLRSIRHEVIVPVSGIHKGVIRALEYATTIAPGHVSAVYVEIDEKSAQILRDEWERWNFGVPLVILKSPYRSLSRPLLNYIQRVDRRNGDDMVTVLLPEFVPAKWWHQLLHNQNSLLLKGLLLFRRNIIVTSVPYHLER